MVNATMHSSMVSTNLKGLDLREEAPIFREFLYGKRERISLLSSMEYCLILIFSACVFSNFSLQPSSLIPATCFMPSLVLPSVEMKVSLSALLRYSLMRVRSFCVRV